MVKTYIAILRGINVSGSKIIKMDTLREMCGKLKFINAQTYIQSGNIVFQFKESDTIELEKKISKKIKAEFGFDVPVLVKEISDWKSVLLKNPFVNGRNVDLSKLHVTFLGKAPEKANWNQLMEGNYGEDEFIVSGKNIYLYCPNSYGNTKLNNNFFEHKLKTTATTRNWKTMLELLRMAEQFEVAK